MPAGLSIIQRPGWLPRPVTRQSRKFEEPMKSADEARLRRFVDFARRAELDDLAVVHDGDLVRKRKCFLLVMRYVERREVELTLQALELEAHLLAQLGVEVGERLVEKQQTRLHHKRAGKSEALLLAAERRVASRPA